MPLPPAPPRPTLGLLHRSSTSVEHRRAPLPSVLSYPGAQGFAGACENPQLVRRRAPGPTIHEGIPQIPQEALALAQSQQHYQQQQQQRGAESTPHQSYEGLASFPTPPQPEDSARSISSPAATAAPATQGAGSSSGGPSDGLEVLPFLPPDAEGSTSPQGLAGLPGGSSPTATKTTGSKSGR